MATYLIGPLHFDIHSKMEHIINPGCNIVFYNHSNHHQPDPNCPPKRTHCQILVPTALVSRANTFIVYMGWRISLWIPFPIAS